MCSTSSLDVKYVHFIAVVSQHSIPHLLLVLGLVFQHGVFAVQYLFTEARCSFFNPKIGLKNEQRASVKRLLLVDIRTLV